MSFQPPQPSTGFLGSLLKELTAQAPAISKQLMDMGKQRENQAKTLLTDYKKQQEAQAKLRNQSFKDLETFSKFSGQDLKPEQKEKLLPFFTQAQEQGLSIPEAYNQALTQYDQAYPYQPPESGHLSYADFLNNPKVRRQGIIDQRQKAYEDRGSPVREPRQFLAGMTEAEIPELSLLKQLFNPVNKGLEALGGPAGITKPIDTLQPTTDRQKKTREFGKEFAETTAREIVGGMVLGAAGKALKPVAVAALKGLKGTPIGKSAEALIKSFAKKAGPKQATQAVNEVVKDLKKNPVFWEGNQFTPEGQGAFYESLAAKAEPGKPSTRTPNTGGMVRKEKLGEAYAKKPTSKERRFLREESKEMQSGGKEKVKLAESQRAEFEKPEIKKEAKTEVKRRAAEDAKRPVRGEKEIKAAADKSEAARKDYLELTRERRRVEDSLRDRKSKKPREDVLKRQKLLKKENDAIEAYRKAQYEAQTGKEYRKGVKADEAAKTALKNIEELAASDTPLTEDVLRGKRGWKPETIAKAKEIADRPRLPGQPDLDSFTQIHDAYMTQYLKRLKDIDKTLSSNKFTTPREYAKLVREQQILDSRVNVNTIKQGQDLRRRTLREISKRAKAADATRYKQVEALMKNKPVYKETLKKIVNLTKTNPESPELNTLMGAVFNEKEIPKVKSWFSKLFKQSSPNITNKAIEAATGINARSPVGKFLKGVLRWVGIPTTLGGTSTLIYKKITGGKSESLDKALKRRRTTQTN